MMASRVFRCVRMLTFVATAASVLVVMPEAAGAASPPKVTITKGPYHDLETIKISVGSNHYFKKYLHINILECADPGGKKRNLPTSVATCDGNTIQGNTVLIASNGSFSEQSYEVFTLPNLSELGEGPTVQPVCNAKKACVLYIGENQVDFNWPKEFSRPFYVLSARKKS
jgi:hypothetical protein